MGFDPLRLGWGIEKFLAGTLSAVTVWTLVLTYFLLLV